jgi:hypothetical protein
MIRRCANKHEAFLINSNNLEKNMNFRKSILLTTVGIALLGCSTPSFHGENKELQLSKNKIYVGLRGASTVPSTTGITAVNIDKNPNNDTVYLAFNNPTTTPVSITSLVLSGETDNPCTVESEHPIQVPAKTFAKIEIIDFSSLEQCVLGNQRSKSALYRVAISGNTQYSSGPNTRYFSNAFMVTVGYSYGQVQSMTNIAAYTFYITSI